MLSTLMSNLQGMVYCCLLDADWTMVFVSDGCSALTGYSPEDLLFNHIISAGCRQFKLYDQAGSFLIVFSYSVRCLGTGIYS